MPGTVLREGTVGAADRGPGADEGPAGVEDRGAAPLGVVDIELSPMQREVRRPILPRPLSLASDVADKLLANPVIESYRVEVD